MRLYPRSGSALALAAALALSSHTTGESLSLVDAVKAGDHDAIRAIMKAHPDVNAREPDGTTALHWAVRADDSETVGLLVRAGAHVNAANRYGVVSLRLLSAPRRPARRPPPVGARRGGAAGTPARGSRHLTWPRPPQTRGG